MKNMLNAVDDHRGVKLCNVNDALHPQEVFPAPPEQGLQPSINRLATDGFF